MANMHILERTGNAYWLASRIATPVGNNAAAVAVTMHASATGFIGPNINAMLTDNAANITASTDA